MFIFWILWIFVHVFCFLSFYSNVSFQVRVYGPGIEHGVLATFQSRFICDTRGAGAGQLTVRVRGPKGAFRVEMQRESQKDRTILCKVLSGFTLFLIFLLGIIKIIKVYYYIFIVEKIFDFLFVVWSNRTRWL